MSGTFDLFDVKCEQYSKTALNPISNAIGGTCKRSLKGSYSATSTEIKQLPRNEIWTDTIFCCTIGFRCKLVYYPFLINGPKIGTPTMINHFGPNFRLKYRAKFHYVEATSLQHVSSKTKTTNKTQCKSQQCIPVGCVPPAHWPYLIVSEGGGMGARGEVVPGEGACMPERHAGPLPCEQNGRLLWKYYLAPNFVCGR